MSRLELITQRSSVSSFIALRIYVPCNKDQIQARPAPQNPLNPLPPLPDPKSNHTPPQTLTSPSPSPSPSPPTTTSQTAPTPPQQPRSTPPATPSRSAPPAARYSPPAPRSPAPPAPRRRLGCCAAAAPRARTACVSFFVVWGGRGVKGRAGERGLI